MEELLVMGIGGIGALLAAALAEGIGEAIGELFGSIFGAVAEAAGEVVAEVGGDAIAEVGGETVGTIGESGTDARTVALGAIAGETAGTGEESSGGSGRTGRFLLTNAVGNHVSNRESRDSGEPAPPTLSIRDKQELNMFENGVNPHLW